jgi:uncharacterized protein (TIGR03435 family)
VLAFSTDGVTQQPAQVPPGGARFEAVTIKRNPSSPNTLPDPTGSYERPDGSFAAINKPIFGLISRSFPPASQIRLRGLENWAHFDRYDVVATSGLGRPATAEEKRAMMRALLTDHFKLVASFDQPEPGGPAVITITQLERPIKN